MEKTKKTFNKLQIALSSTSHMVTDLYSSFIVGLIPILTQKFGLSLFLVGILSSVNFIANSFTQPVFGYLSDRYGTRHFMVLGPFFASVFISMLGILPAYYLIIIFLFLGNLSISAFHPSSASIAGHFGGERSGLGNSVISFGGNLGYSLGSLFVIFIVERFGLEYTPFAMIPGIIMSAILLKLVQTPEKFLNQEKREPVNLFKKAKNIKKSKIGLISIIVFTSYSRDIIWVSLATFLPLYLTNRGTTLTNVGYFLLLFGVVGGIGGLISGYFFDKIRESTILIQAGLLISVPLFYLLFRLSGPLSILFYILGGFFLISTLPLCIRLAQEIMPSNVALASSFVIGLSGGLAAITVILLGKIADIIGIVSTMNYVLILPLIAFILLIFFPALRKRI